MGLGGGGLAKIFACWLFLSSAFQFVHFGNRQKIKTIVHIFSSRIAVPIATKKYSNIQGYNQKIGLQECCRNHRKRYFEPFGP